MNTKARRHAGNLAANCMTEDVVALIDSELTDLTTERAALESKALEARTEFSAAKKQFEVEEKDEANSKAYGQPVRAKIEEISKRMELTVGLLFGAILLDLPVENSWKTRVGCLGLADAYNKV